MRFKRRFSAVLHTLRRRKADVVLRNLARKVYIFIAVFAVYLRFPVVLCGRRIAENRCLSRVSENVVLSVCGAAGNSSTARDDDHYDYDYGYGYDETTLGDEAMFYAERLDIEYVDDLALASSDAHLDPDPDVEFDVGHEKQRNGNADGQRRRRPHSRCDRGTKLNK